MNKAITVGVYARIKATGQVGRVGAKYRHGRDGLSATGSRITWGIDWGGEYSGLELERITPKEYHQSPNKVKA